MDIKEILFQKLLEELRIVKEEDQFKQFIVNEEKYQKFVEIVKKSYELFLELSINDFDIENEPGRIVSCVHFYFKHFKLDEKKYQRFLKIVNEADGASFSSYHGLVELTISVSDVWKEVEYE